MSVLFERLEKEIRKQTEAHKGDAIEMAGERLLDIVRGKDDEDALATLIMIMYVLIHDGRGDRGTEDAATQIAEKDADEEKREAI